MSTHRVLAQYRTTSAPVTATLMDEPVWHDHEGNAIPQYRGSDGLIYERWMVEPMPATTSAHVLGHTGPSMGQHLVSDLHAAYTQHLDNTGGWTAATLSLVARVSMGHARHALHQTVGFGGPTVSLLPLRDAVVMVPTSHGTNLVPASWFA